MDKQCVYSLSTCDLALTFALGAIVYAMLSLCCMNRLGYAATISGVGVNVCLMNALYSVVNEQYGNTR